MWTIKLKLVFILLIFLLLDFLKPLGFHFTPEFLFLGVLFASLNFPLNITLPLIISFGVLKDFFSLNTFPFHTVFFVTVDVSTRYLITYFPDKHLLRRLLAALFILFYACLNSLAIWHFPFPLIFLFFTQSFFVFCLMEHFLLLWIQNLFQEQ